MQVVEKLNEGLSRSYEITIDKADLATKLEAKIKEIAPKMNVKGFRPGKVPVAHVKKLYSRDLMSEIIQEALSDSTQKALDDAKVRPAAQPDLKPTSDLEKVVTGLEDLVFSIDIEAMPDFTPIEITEIELTRPVYEVTEADIQEVLGEILEKNTSYVSKEEADAVSQSGDKLIIDFLGKLGEEAFEGGAAQDAELVIGSNTFIPGFEEQLIGVKKGDTPTLQVTFPEAYGAAHLAGKEATFEITVKDILAPIKSEATEEFATGLGLESLDKLKEVLKTNLESQYSQNSRFKLKRALLDLLDEKHSFDLPSRMLEAEFAGIWAQVEQDKSNGQLSDEDLAKSDDDLKAEYRKIAERRVRLGLVLAEIGTLKKVQVTDQEVGQAIMAEARNYPGQEKQVFDFYRENPQAAAQIRAPIFEEKVCDLIFSVAKLTDKPVTKEELLEEIED